MLVRRGFLSLAVIGVLLLFGSISTSRNISPSWNFRIEDMTDFAMSSNGEYIIVACEKGPLCNEGQYYVFDRYGNTVGYECIESEITAVDIADNGSFFVGTRNGYYFHTSSGKIQEELDIGIMFQSVSMSENGQVVAGTDGEIFIFDENGNKIIKEVGRPILNTAISASGNIAIAGTEDKIFVYEKPSKKWEEKLVNVGGIGDLAISDDGSTIICGMPTQNIWILDSRLNIMRSLMVKGSVYSVAVTANGEFFVCGTKQGDLYYFNSAGDEIWQRNLEKAIEDVFVSSDGNLVAALSENIILFNSLRKEPQELRASGSIERMQFSRFGEILCYISDDELAFLELYQRFHVPTCEYMIPSRKSIPLDDQFERVWSYGKNPRAAVVADINGDGNNEIVCTLDKEVVVLSSEGRELWKKSFQFQPGFAVFDVTGDFIPEVIVTTNDNRMEIQVFNERGERIANHEFYSRWYAQPPSQEQTIGIQPVLSSDIDNDDSIEVVCIVSAGYVLNPRGLFVFEYPSFEEQWYYPVAPHLSAIHVIDINGDGHTEIVAGSNAPCNGRQVGNTNDCHAYVYAVTLEGKELWKKEIGSGFKRVSIAVADLDGDGKQEIVGAGWSYEDNWGALFVLDSDGEYIFGKEKYLDYSVFLECVTDLDSDGDLEILTSYYPSVLVLYDHGLRVINRQDVSMKLGLSGSLSINDIDADGEKEIILTSDGRELSILNSELVEEQSIFLPGNITEAMVINLSGCKNDLLILADKLYLYSFSGQSPQPCELLLLVNLEKEIEEHIMKGDTYFEEGNFEKAVKEYDSAIRKLQQLDDTELLSMVAEKRTEAYENSIKYSEAESLLQKGRQLLEKGDLQEAKEVLLKAKEIFNSINRLDKVQEADLLLDEIEDLNLAREYTMEGDREESLKNYEKAIENYENALKIYEDLGMTEETEEVRERLEQSRNMLEQAKQVSITSINKLIMIIALTTAVITTSFFFLSHKKYRGENKKTNITSYLFTIASLIAVFLVSLVVMSLPLGNAAYLWTISICLFFVMILNTYIRRM